MKHRASGRRIAFTVAIAALSATSLACGLFGGENDEEGDEGEQASGPTIADVVVTNEFACALRSDGRVYCWGRNDKGQLGDESTTDRWDRAAPVSGLDDAVAIAAYGSSACAIRRGGAVSCWGYVPGTENDHATAPRPIAGITDAVDISIDGSMVAVAGSDGRVWVFGRNSVRAALPEAGERLGAPTLVPGLTGVRVAVGYLGVCATSVGGDVRCTGYDPSTYDSPGPYWRLHGAAFSGVTGSPLRVGPSLACFTVDGRLRCIGDPQAASAVRCDAAADRVGSVAEVYDATDVVPAGLGASVGVVYLEADGTLGCRGSCADRPGGGTVTVPGGIHSFDVEANMGCAATERAVTCWGRVSEPWPSEGVLWSGPATYELGNL